MRLPGLPRLRLWVGVAALSLGLALAARDLIPTLYAPAQPPPLRPRLDQSEPAVRAVERDGAVLVVYADVLNAADAADNLDKAAAVAASVGQALRAGVSDDLAGARTVRFVFRCQAVNRFGQDVMAQLMTLELPLGVLRQSRALSRPADLLGLAEKVTLGAPGSYDAVSAWCADAARRNPAFCAKAAA